MPGKKEVAGHKVPKIICPFHGLVEAKPDRDAYRCSGDNCQIMRSEKELE